MLNWLLWMTHCWQRYMQNVILDNGIQKYFPKNTLKKLLWPNRIGNTKKKNPNANPTLPNARYVECMPYPQFVGSNWTIATIQTIKLIIATPKKYKPHRYTKFLRRILARSVRVLLLSTTNSKNQLYDEEIDW